MPVAKVQLPDGRIGRFEVPEGATPEQVLEFVQNMPNMQPPPSQRQAEDESMAAYGAMKNAPPLTLQDKAKKAFGFKDYSQRGTLLPIGENEDKSLELAWPQVAVDMATSFMLPKHAMTGGHYTPEDVTKFALDYAVPATMKKLPSGPAKPSRSDVIASAPTTDDLFKGGSAKFDAAKGTGLALKPEKYVDFLADLETKVGKEGIDPMLHPKATAVFNAMGKRVGDEVDVGDIQTIRRQVGIASNTVAPELADERRIAGIMRESLDKMVDDITDADVLAGKADGVAEGLRDARALWSQAKKSELIENIIEKAQTQASGSENGLRIGFRALLNNKKAIRGFTNDEVSAIKEVAIGTPTTKALRILGKLSFGTRGGNNWLGGSVGVGAGSAAFGPVGAIASPIIGYAAQKGADSSTRQAAEFARALAASGGSLPTGNAQMAEILMRGAPSVSGAETVQNSQYRRLLQQILSGS